MQSLERCIPFSGQDRIGDCRNHNVECLQNFPRDYYFAEGKDNIPNVDYTKE